MKVTGVTIVGLVYGLGAIALAGTIGLATMSNRPVDQFTRDPLSVTDTPPYVGLLSNLTAAAWFTAAGALWAISARLWSGSPSSRRRAAALASVAGLTTLLGLDDLFMLHEEMLQRHAGINEALTVGVYGLIALAIAVIFRRALAQTPWRLLIVAGAFFGACLAVDLLTSGFGWRIVIEDSLKFLGVTGVLAFAMASAMDQRPV